MTAAAPFGRFWVYLHLADDGRVLYAGCSYAPSERERHHKAMSAWWPQVAQIKVFGPFSMAHARQIERTAIELLDPPNNIVFTTRWAWHPQNRNKTTAA